MTLAREIAATVAAILREIFDESAYKRFLERYGLTSCPTAYAAFLCEQEGIKAGRAKCC